MPPPRIHSENWRQFLQPQLVVWAVYIVLVPFYVFKSGLPQPGDLFILVLVPVGLRGWNGKLAPSALAAFRPLIWFTVWVCLVDYSWAFILGNFGLFGMDTFVLFPVYYIYNTLIFLIALILYRRYGDAFLRLTLFVVFVTLGIQVVASFVIRQSSFRGSLFFNNPNQLGYYALLAGCLIAVTHKRLKFKLLTSSLGLTSCGYLALLSASRAAAAGVAILLILIVFSNPRIIVLASLAAIGLVAAGGPISDAIDSSQQRASANRNPNMTFFQERGYDRIWAHKEYLVLGAGEGGLSRFADTSVVKNMEIHSSAGMVLFSYGVVGVALFLAFMWRLARGASVRASLMLTPVLIYTVAHQGLRFTMLWVLLAVFVVVKDDELPSRRTRNPVVDPIPRLSP